MHFEVANWILAQSATASKVKAFANSCECAVSSKIPSIEKLQRKAYDVESLCHVTLLQILVICKKLYQGMKF